MNSKHNSLPSLSEAIEELRSLLRSPQYRPTTSSELLAREQAYYAGQLWAIEKLETINAKYQKGDA